VPTGLAATPGNNFVVNLSWQASTSSAAGAVRYRVFRNGVAIGTQQLALTYTDQRKKVNTFTYQVRAIDSAGRKSALSAPVTVTTVKSTTGSGSTTGPDVTAPSTPAGLTAVAQGYRYVGLSWQPSTDDRTGTIEYRLFRDDVRIATLTSTSYVDRPASPGTYRYKVRAVDKAGNKSPFSPNVTGQAVKGPL
jgi:chitinase